MDSKSSLSSEKDRVTVDGSLCRTQLYGPHVHPSNAAVSGFKYMSRGPLALGLAGGSLSSVLFRFASELVQQQGPWENPLIEPVLACAGSEFSGYIWGLDTRSLLVGIFIGLTLWPILELLFLVRHWWASVVRRQLVILGRISGPLYREI